MKKLLIIGYVWPEPNSSAAGQRMMELIHLFLAQEWQISFASAAALSEHRYNLQHLGIQEKIIALNCGSFNEFISELMPDMALYDRFFTEEQFGWRVAQCCPNALRILDTEDLHCLRSARHKLLMQSQRNLPNEAERQAIGPILATPAQLYEYMSADDLAQREIAAIFRCDLTLMISQVEMSFLTDFFSVPAQLIHYCPFLDSKKTSFSALAFSQRQHFLCIGNFRHLPNWDAVLYLKHALWPLIREQLPHAELHIYGAYPPPKATQLHNPKQGFHVKGWAEDALAVMSEARICLAPLRFGAGIKGKLMDAMRCGTPSVTTAIGAEAMQGEYAWGGAIENTARDFAQAAVDLYSDEKRWHIAQQCGFELLHNVFASEKYAVSLNNRIEILYCNVIHERRQNFIGTMLRHHSLKSTQYMSQWIEAKNSIEPK